MKKIISLFKRDYEGNRQVYDEVVEGAEWVIQGEGVATVKYDGTCCMVRDGKLYKRYEVKVGGTPPSDFEPANEIDPNTGKQQGWRPVGEGPDDKWHRQAFTPGTVDGTYELVGPKVQGNPHQYPAHKLIPHGSHVVNAPRTFQDIRNWFCGGGDTFEGIVWHHPDGRMVKIKRRDFGLKWPI